MPGKFTEEEIRKDIKAFIASLQPFTVECHLDPYDNWMKKHEGGVSAQAHSHRVQMHLVPKNTAADEKAVAKFMAKYMGTQEDYTQFEKVASYEIAKAVQDYWNEKKVSEWSYAKEFLIAMAEGSSIQGYLKTILTLQRAEEEVERYGARTPLQPNTSVTIQDLYGVDKAITELGEFGDAEEQLSFLAKEGLGFLINRLKARKKEKGLEKGWITKDKSTECIPLWGTVVYSLEHHLGTIGWRDKPGAFSLRSGFATLDEEKYHFAKARPDYNRWVEQTFETLKEILGLDEIDSKEKLESLTESKRNEKIIGLSEDEINEYCNLLLGLYDEKNRLGEKARNERDSDSKQPIAILKKDIGEKSLADFLEKAEQSAKEQPQHAAFSPQSTTLLYLRQSPASSKKVKQVADEENQIPEGGVKANPKKGGGSGCKQK